MPATPKVSIDWNDDGDYSDTGENVTARVLDADQFIQIRYGRDQARALSPIAAGEAHFTLNNISRDYSPENASSPLTGNLLPARPVLLQDTLGATTYTLFSGVTDDFTIRPDLAERRVNVDCVDALGQLKGISVTSGLYQGLRTGDAINVVLDAAGWPAASRDIDAGGSTLPFFWLDQDDAFTALTDLLASEGPPSLLTVDSAGRVVFRDRHHRLQRTASTTSQSTWRSSGTEPCFSAPTTYNNGFKEIINSVSFELDLRQIDGAPTPVWSSEGITTVASGDTLLITARGTTPFANAIVPEQDTDYLLLSGTPLITITRTSGASTAIAIQAVGGAAVLQDLQLRAYAVTTVTTVMVTAQDGGSISKYGRRSMPDSITPKWASLPDAQAIATLVLAYRAERLPTIAVTMKADAGTVRLTQMLTRNLSDRVHIIESHTGLDADCFIEQISHEIGSAGREHHTMFGCEKAPAQATNAFILGSATKGVLGTNVLGKRGLADPNTMFVLGSGVLGANILTA